MLIHKKGEKGGQDRFVMVLYQTKPAITHIFERICRENDIEHRKTQVKHPWTNGQVERMNRTLKDATVHTFTYCTHDQLKVY